MVARRQMGVPRGHFRIAMSHQLHPSLIRYVVHRQPRAEGMPQIMPTKIFDTGRLQRGVERLPPGGPRAMLSVFLVMVEEDDILRLRLALIMDALKCLTQIIVEGNRSGVT